MSFPKEFEWDFDDALGNTIAEKCDGLYDLIASIFVNFFIFDAIATDTDIALIFSSPIIEFEENVDPFTDTTDPIYLGGIGPKRIKLYASERLNREILLVNSDGDYVVIRVINF